MKRTIRNELVNGGFYAGVLLLAFLLSSVALWLIRRIIALIVLRSRR